ncbi:MAG: HEAT repeat domain-containing protein, partial [Planctomycetota bacterium]
MTRSLTRLSLVASLALLGSASHLWAQDADSKFREGLDLLKRGEAEAALVAFQDALAADPSQEMAYDLWQQTDTDLWLKLLAKEGQYELIAKRFMHLAEMGRKARTNDQDVIRELIGDLAAPDRATRVAAERKLAADHGEFAVPFLVYRLADQGNDDLRTTAMVTLPRLGDQVVPPLVEALATSDAFLRRNVAAVLGYVSDPRAAGPLAKLVETDEDPVVREVAQQSLERCGGAPAGALDALLVLGNAYHNELPGALRPHQYSGVIWEWQGNKLEPIETPRFLYRHEMAKKAYYDALDLAPNSSAALAGVARVTVAEQELVAEWSAVGVELGAWEARLASDELAVAMAGADALDGALASALAQRDEVAASGLARALAHSANAPTPALEDAMLRSTSGAVRGEAAIALAHIAVRANAAAGQDVVQALGDAAGRDGM